jgi:hypothetical protein
METSDESPTEVSKVAEQAREELERAARQAHDAIARQHAEATAALDAHRKRRDGDRPAAVAAPVRRQPAEQSGARHADGEAPPPEVTAPAAKAPAHGG